MKGIYPAMIPLAILVTTCVMAGFAMPKSTDYTVASTAPFETTVDTSWTKQKAASWFRKRQWLNGLKLTPHSSIDQLRFAKEYHSNKSRWDKGFAYLKAANLATLKAGHYQIEGEDVYANVTEAASKPFDETQYEVHQNYSDIHLLITGREKIAITSFDGATVKTPYDAAKDIGFWNKPGGKVYTMVPGTFYVFTPGSPHRPTIQVAGQKLVKKIVIKIKAAGK